MNNNIISEIKNFLDGENQELKYIVNVEGDYNTNIMKCIVHDPNDGKSIKDIKYTPFLFIKDFKKEGIELYSNNKEIIPSKMLQYGIKIIKLETGGQKRLEDGYCYKVTSTQSYQSILNFFKDGGVDIYEKKKDSRGKWVKDKKGDYINLYRHLFYTVKPEEQFFIDRKTRLFKGIEDYNNLHRMVFDIETTGLRTKFNRIFAIGIKDNFKYQRVLEVEKMDDDESEKQLIIDFFDIIQYLKPAVICGYNSEEFDFNFILERAKILGLDLTKIKTTIDEKFHIKRKNATVKIGGESMRYVSTDIWGTSVIDIMHAVKKTMAINSDIREYGLKYICKFEDIAKPNRTYIHGEDNGIGGMWTENKIFFINPENNNYRELPIKYQELGRNLYKLQNSKINLGLNDLEYKEIRNKFISENIGFVDWYKNILKKDNYTKLITGKEILRQYLIDDLWETEQVDMLYNQASFLLGKIIPTTYHRVCTMGTAATWNLLLTAWSYDNNIAIPVSDVNEKFGGGLSRCFKRGYAEDIIKIDFASLYPMLQLTHDIFPIFDISNIIKKILIYLTTTRNVYKKMASGDELNNNELDILKLNNLDDILVKYHNGTLSDSERKVFKVKQLPIKILNNSLFGALGSGFAFNWSDNICASRITSCGRLELRHAISWFKDFGCEPLLSVTDGINFGIPKSTNIIVTNEYTRNTNENKPISEMWKYNNKTGISALIEKFNMEEMKGDYMAVDNDGEFISCLNLSRNNYALLYHNKKKNKRDIKLIGGTIKSKVMPEYIEDFINEALIMILEGRGGDFHKYYNSYCEDIFYKRIPLKKIASKKRIKNTIKEYIERGTDKNGRPKAKQAHMELIINERINIAKKLFLENQELIEKSYGEIIEKKYKGSGLDSFEMEDLFKFVSDWMPSEPELDSTLYLLNTGYKKGDGDSSIIKDNETGEDRMASMIISKKDLVDNPNMLGDYNVDKYLDAFNERIKNLLEGFNDEIKSQLLGKIKKTKYKDEFGVKRQKMELVINNFTDKQLQLSNYVLDEYDEAMTLSDDEVKFWNKYGYNPYKLWGGFNINDNKLRTDIYDKALEYLNNKMSNNNQPLIKRVDDEKNVNDFILYKIKNDFYIGKYNGKYVTLRKEKLEIPDLDLIDFGDEEYEFEKEFREKYNITKNVSLFDLFNIQPKAKMAYSDLVRELSVDYYDVDDY